MRPMVIALMAQSLAGQEAGWTTRPVLRGREHAVSSRKPQATQVAARVLAAGGNAFDAAVAGQAALAVTDPAMNGVGGDAFLLVYDARTGQVVSINAGGTAPRLATIEWYRKNAGGQIPANDGLLSASLPTVVESWYVLLSRWGTKSFAELLSPAIELAENGFPVSEHLSAMMEANSAKLAKYPTSARIYLPGGRAPRPGQILRNPDLARTLRLLLEAEQKAAAGGRQAGLQAARDRFYKGDIARALGRFSQQNGGLYRYEDLAGYAAEIEEPVWIDYRGLRVYKNPSATQGPTELMFLKLLQGYDLKALGHNSADYIHTSIEAAKLAYADRERFLADQKFVPIPFARLLSDEYAAGRRKLIDPHKASLELRPGEPAAHRPNLGGDAKHEGDTSYIAVVDRERNAVSFTPSLHWIFGTGVVMGETGIIFNCRGDYYELDPAHANSLAPGKRARSTLTPTLVLKDGKPFLVAGSPGGDDQPLRIAQTFLNLVEFGMNIQQAIEAPRYSTSSFPSSYFPHTMYPGQISLESRIPAAVRKALERRGHKIEVSGPWSLNASAAILIDPETGVLSAGADPRGDTYALAW